MEIHTVQYQTSPFDGRFRFPTIQVSGSRRGSSLSCKTSREHVIWKPLPIYSTNNVSRRPQCGACECVAHLTCAGMITRAFAIRLVGHSRTAPNPQRDCHINLCPCFVPHVADACVSPCGPLSGKAQRHQIFIWVCVASRS